MRPLQSSCAQSPRCHGQQWSALLRGCLRQALCTLAALPHPCTDAVGSTGPDHDVLQTLNIAPGTSAQAPQIDYRIQHQLPWTMEGGLPSSGSVVNVDALLAQLVGGRLEVSLGASFANGVDWRMLQRREVQVTACFCGSDAELC